MGRTRREKRALPTLGNETTQCLMCRHLRTLGEHFSSLAPSGWKCAAFGDDDIPGPIVRGRFDHRRRWLGTSDTPSDNGTTFEDAKGADPTYEELAGPLEDIDVTLARFDE